MTTATRIASDPLSDFRAFCVASALMDASVDHGCRRVALRRLHQHFIGAGWSREEVHQAINHLMDRCIVGFRGEPDGRLFVEFDPDDLTDYLTGGAV